MKEAVRVEIEVVEEVQAVGREMGMAVLVRVRCEVPEQDKDLPDCWEQISQEAGLQFMRKLFGLGIEKSDLELILSLRAGDNGKGIVRIGKRPYTFRTSFRTVIVPRIRIKYKGSGKSETPSGRIWQLPRQVYFSRGLKNAVCNLAMKETYGSTLKQIERETGEVGIICKSSVINIVHAQGAGISAAEIERADKVFEADNGAKVLLGRAGAHLAEDYFEKCGRPHFSNYVAF
jgi:hypothetical protein